LSKIHLFEIKLKVEKISVNKLLITPVINLKRSFEIRKPKRKLKVLQPENKDLFKNS